MIRLIKRYGSRKLYDTEESRYVSLEEVAEFVRSGQDVRVLDNATDHDVTVQTLTQVISEEGRSDRRTIPAEVLHELIRYSGKRVRRGVEQVTSGFDRLVQSSLERFTPVGEARQELDLLRQRLEQIERTVEHYELEESAANRKRSDSRETVGSRSRAGAKKAPRKPAKAARRSSSEPTAATRSGAPTAGRTRASKRREADPSASSSSRTKRSKAPKPRKKPPKKES